MSSKHCEYIVLRSHPHIDVNVTIARTIISIIIITNASIINVSAAGLIIAVIIVAIVITITTNTISTGVFIIICAPRRHIIAMV